MRYKVICTGYENQGICAMCGGPLPSGRRTYCSTECYELYYDLFFWAQAAQNAMYRAHHKCQVCGITARGLSRIELATWGHHFLEIYRLEVHHIIPLNGQDRTWHALNIPGNLLVVCHECHVILHSRKHQRQIEHDRRQLTFL